MWADIDTKQNLLNYGEATAIVAEIIRDERMLPASVGVFGSWGTGKSSLLNIIEAELRADPATKDAIVVRFDAWLYQGYDDAKAALLASPASPGSAWTEWGLLPTRAGAISSALRTSTPICRPTCRPSRGRGRPRGRTPTRDDPVGKG